MTVDPFKHLCHRCRACRFADFSILCLTMSSLPSGPESWKCWANVVSWGSSLWTLHKFDCQPGCPTRACSAPGLYLITTLLYSRCRHQCCHHCYSMLQSRAVIYHTGSLLWRCQHFCRWLHLHSIAQSSYALLAASTSPCNCSHSCLGTHQKSLENHSIGFAATAIIKTKTSRG